MRFLNHPILTATFIVFTTAGCIAPKTTRPDVTDVAIKAEQDTQIALAITRFVQQNEKLRVIASRVNLANVKGCKEDIAPLIGLNYLVPQDYEEGMGRATALKQLALPDDAETNALYAYAIYEDSPVGKEGIQRGDRLLKLNDLDLSGPVTEDILEALTIAEGRNTLTVERGGKRRSLSVTAQAGCSYALEFTPDTAVNAYADGETIFITQGMMNFIETDEELALVYGHELAHNTEGHGDSKRINAMAGMAGGLLLDVAIAAVGVNTQGAFMNAGGSIGSRAYSTDFEKEADYIGLFFSANAGFDMVKAPDFWRRMATENESRAIKAATTHPTTAERYLLLGKTQKEIEDKRAAGLPLQPSYVEKPSTSEATEISEPGR